MDKIKNNNFHYIILAAGCSRRLLGFNKGNPKSLLKVNKKEIIHYHLDNIIKNKGTSISIILGYKYHKIIKNMQKHYPNLKINYIYTKDYEFTGHSWTIYQSKNIATILKKPVIIIHADNVFSSCIYDIIHKSTKKNTILIDKKFKILTNDEMVVFGRNNIVDNIQYIYENKNKPIGEFLGIHKFDYNNYIKFLEFMEPYFKKHGKEDGYEKILNKYIYENNSKMYYEDIGDYNWININFKEDYYSAQNFDYTL